MEKIKVALAKAKLKSSDVNKTSKTTDKQLNTAEKSYSSSADDIGNITYTQTSIIMLDSTHLEKNRIVAHLENDVNSAIFDSLRTQILQKMEENNWQTLAVVSPTPESGKTVVSINLAISIAQQQQKTVILVDFDLRRPKVSTYLGLHIEKSMNEYLIDKAELRDVMINPGIQRLVVVPTAKAVAKSAEMLSSKKVTSLIQELKGRYESRVVVFDSPPVLYTDDAIVLFKHVDCVLLVIAEGMSTEAEIEETFYHLPKEKLLGVVINKADTEPKSYYY